MNRLSPTVRKVFIVVVVFALLTILGWILGVVLVPVAAGVDLQMLETVAAVRDPVASTGFTWISFLGSEWVIAPLAGLTATVLIGTGRYREAALVVVLVVGVAALDAVVKDLVDRVRPPVHHLVSVNSPSFPSGHAAQAVATYAGFAYLLALRTRTFIWSGLVIGAAALLVLGVGFSRVYLGVHYPSDVLGGYLLGAGWLGSIIFALGDRAPRSKLERRL